MTHCIAKKVPSLFTQTLIFHLYFFVSETWMSVDPGFEKPDHVTLTTSL